MSTLPILTIAGFALLAYYTRFVCFVVLDTGRLSPERLMAFIADERGTVTRDFEGDAGRLRIAYRVLAVLGGLLVITFGGLRDVTFILPALFCVELLRERSNRESSADIDKEIETRRRKSSNVFVIEPSQANSTGLLLRLYFDGKLKRICSSQFIPSREFSHSLYQSTP